MGKNVHIIPVGFDFERLSQPISKGNLAADRIKLLNGSSGSNEEETHALTDRMLEQLEFTFDRMLGLEVEIESISDVHGYEDAYVTAYRMILEEIRDGNQIWINISSMPRTVAFAFATAANSLIVEEPSRRNDIHTYYVAPEEYLVVDMISELEKTRDVLKQEIKKDTSDSLQERFDSIDNLLSEIESSGVTKGAQRMNGGLHVEFPAVTSGELRDFEEEIIRLLVKVDATESTSKLAQLLADQFGIESDDSFRSKVQYNVSRLQEKGYINRSEENNSYRTSLSTMGKLWARTHLDIS